MILTTSVSAVYVDQSPVFGLGTRMGRSITTTICVEPVLGVKLNVLILQTGKARKGKNDRRHLHDPTDKCMVMRDL